MRLEVLVLFLAFGSLMESAIAVSPLRHGEARKLLQTSAIQDGEGTQTVGLADGETSIVQDAGSPDETAGVGTGLGGFFDPSLLGEFPASLLGAGAPGGIPGFGGVPPVELPAGFAEFLTSFLPAGAAAPGSEAPAGAPITFPGLEGGFPGLTGASPAVPGVPGVAGLPDFSSVPGFPADFSSLPGVGDTPIPGVGEGTASIPGVSIPGLGDVPFPAIPGVAPGATGEGTAAGAVPPVDFSSFLPGGGVIPEIPGLPAAVPGAVGVPEVPAGAPRTGLEIEAQPQAAVTCDTAPTQFSISGQTFEATSCTTVPAAAAP